MPFILALLSLCLAPSARSQSVAASSRTLVVCDDVVDPATLDPQKEFSEKNHTIVQQIFEGLVRFDADGKIVPALATQWRRLSPTAMQFDLRKGVYFHNGEPFNAESVRFSIERYLDPKTSFPARGFIETIDHVDIVDDHRVNIVTRMPDGLLLNRIAGFIVMVPPGYYKNAPESVLQERPVGTGAFAFKKWIKGDRIELVANRSYWHEGYPRVAGLVFRFIPVGDQVRALMAGSIDVLTNLPGTKTLEVQHSRNTYVVKRETFYTVAGNFNTTHAPLSDIRVRKAINLAVDRQALVRYDILGNGNPIGTLTSPGEFGHNPKILPYPFDLKRALQLLSAAGYPHGFRLRVLLKVNAERTGRIIASQLAKIGVKEDLTLVSDSELFAKLRDRSHWDMAIYDVPDPMCHAFFVTSIFLSGQSPFALSSATALDDQFSRLVGTLDRGRQREIAKGIDDFVHSNYLALPTYQRIRTYGLRRNVLFVPYVSGMPYFFSTEIKKEAPIE
ncbi:MAG: hypothetical protein HKL90_02490 [Elusimicrobia bacterium]|nr:hypothetical protein [Elusimicrobiota bacterium]